MYLTCELFVSPKEDKMLVCLTPSSSSSPKTGPGTQCFRKNCSINECIQKKNKISLAVRKCPTVPSATLGGHPFVR